MKKNTFAFGFILTLIFALCILYYKKIEEEKQKSETVKTEIIDINQTKTKSQEEKIQETSQKDWQDKVKTLRKRLSLKGLLIKWDYFLDNAQPKYALQKYLLAYKEAPDDEKIIRKIADTYFEINSFKNSTIFYSKLLNSPEIDNERYIFSMIYSSDYSKTEKTFSYIENIKSLDIPDEEKFYYTNSLYCLIDFHECKVKFNDYLFDSEKEITHAGLLNIKEAIQKYRDFGSWEIYFKDLNLANAFVNNKLFPISAYISEQILKQKPNYLSALKIWGKSLFELWEYENANLMLKKVYKIDPSDKNLAYILWVINFELKDYETSNLYLHASLKTNPNDIDILRKIVYNYHLIWDDTNLLNFFERIIDTGLASQNDFYLWIYSAIRWENYLKWVKWANIWQEKFPKDEMFRWYYWWIYREWDEINESLKHLWYWYKVNPRNPFITLNYWLTYMSKWDYKLAKWFFEKTIEINWDWEFWSIASENLKVINDL